MKETQRENRGKRSGEKSHMNANTTQRSIVRSSSKLIPTPSPKHSNKQLGEQMRTKYQMRLRELESDRPRYEQEMKAQFDACQDREQKRLDFFKRTLLHYQTIVAKTYANVWEELKENLQDINSDADLVMYASRHGPGMPLMVPQYVEYGEKEVPKISSPSSAMAASRKQSVRQPVSVMVSMVMVFAVCCSTVWLFGCLAVWLVGCLAVWLVGCLIVWLFGCLAVWLFGCLIVWLSVFDDDIVVVVVVVVVILRVKHYFVLFFLFFYFLFVCFPPFLPCFFFFFLSLSRCFYYLTPIFPHHLSDRGRGRRPHRVRRRVGRDEPHGASPRRRCCGR